MLAKSAVAVENSKIPSVWLLTAPDRIGLHLTAPNHLEHHTGPSGAFSELLMIHVVQLSPS